MMLVGLQDSLGVARTDEANADTSVRERRDLNESKESVVLASTDKGRGRKLRVSRYATNQLVFGTKTSHLIAHVDLRRQSSRPPREPAEA